MSPLRSHKSHHNFLDSHSDICYCIQGIEDVSHFLFLCPSFATQRVTLAVSVMEILQSNNLNQLSNQSELYLYGHRPINVIDNRKILLSKIYKGYSPFCILNSPHPPPPPQPLPMFLQAYLITLFVHYMLVCILFFNHV